MIISQLELGLPVVKQDWFQVSHSIRHAQKTHMSLIIDQASYSFRRAQKTHMLVEIDFKCRSLFSTLRKHTCQVRLLQVSHFIRHDQKTHVKQDWLLSLALYSTRIAPQHAQKTHMSSEIDYNTRTLFGTHTQNAHFKQGWLQVSYSIQHTQKTHMPSEFDYNTRTPYGTHKTHMSSEIDYNTLTLFDMQKNARVKGDRLKSCTLFETYRNARVN